MKLRNLLFATMFAVAFVGCSNDDDPIVGPVAGDTTLAIKIADVQTKADSDIKNLTVIIANASGNIEAVQPATTFESGEITLEGGSKRMIVLANVDASAFAKDTSYAAVATAKTTFDKEGVVDGAEATSLSMNSKEYTFTITPGTKHYIGYNTTEAADKAGAGNTKPIQVLDENTVKMYRNVAKANIKGVQVSATWGTDDLTKNYPNPSFEMSEILIVQSPGTSSIVGANLLEWGKTFNNANYITPWADAASYAAASIGEIYKKADWGGEETSYKYSFASPYLVGYNEEKKVDGATYAPAEMIPFYVYENLDTIAKSENLTIMAVKGTFKYDGLAADGKSIERKSLPNRYYPFALGVTGFENSGYTNPLAISIADAGRTADFAAKLNGKAIGVLRNLQYNVSMTLNGIGYPTPWGPPPGGETATLDVKVEVVGWGQVDQPVVIP